MISVTVNRTQDTHFCKKLIEYCIVVGFTCIILGAIAADPQSMQRRWGHILLVIVQSCLHFAQLVASCKSEFICSRLNHACWRGRIHYSSDPKPLSPKWPITTVDSNQIKIETHWRVHNFAQTTVYRHCHWHSIISGIPGALDNPTVGCDNDWFSPHPVTMHP